jgi:hypothetical protein
MKRWREALIVGVAVWVAGCATAVAPGPPTSSARVGGLWVGSVTGTAGSVQMEMTLIQQGDQIRGTAETTYRGDPLRGTVEARLTGDTLQGDILGPSRSASFSLSVRGDVLRGTLAAGVVELRREGYLARSVYRSESAPGQAP